MIKPTPILLLAAFFAAAPAASAPGESSTITASASRLVASAPFRRASTKLERDYERIIADTIGLTEIPAPPFKEQKRAEAFRDLLVQHGLDDVEIDAEGNAMGLRKGTGGGPLLVVAAHLDTVFPEGTDTRVRREGNKLFAPGISDDTVSLSVILGFIRALDDAGIRTRSDILFVGDVGEEELGNLRGTRHLFENGKYKDRIAYFLSFEPGAGGGITHVAVGSKRYEVVLKGPGGHSLIDFGLVNPSYPMADIVGRFGQYSGPLGGRTVYNVGLVHGGTSVNAIPASMAVSVDMRSESAANLAALEKYFLDLVPAAVARENATRSTARGPIAAEIKLIGERPVGNLRADSRIVATAAAAIVATGGKPSLRSGSSDSNIPISAGREGVTLDNGFKYEAAHSPAEALELDKPTNLAGMRAGLATILLLAGIAP